MTKKNKKADAKLIISIIAIILIVIAIVFLVLSMINTESADISKIPQIKIPVDSLEFNESVVYF